MPTARFAPDENPPLSLGTGQRSHFESALPGQRASRPRIPCPVWVLAAVTEWGGNRVSFRGRPGTTAASCDLSRRPSGSALPCTVVRAGSCLRARCACSCAMRCLKRAPFPAHGRQPWRCGKRVLGPRRATSSSHLVLTRPHPGATCLRIRMMPFAVLAAKKVQVLVCGVYRARRVCAGRRWIELGFDCRS